jgi:phage gp29-like protein
MREIVGSPFTGNVFNRRVPARLKASAAPLRAARSNINSAMQRIIRRQAMGNWLLPSLAAVTPQYIETILRGALGGNHVQQWELFDLMEDTWPRLLKNLGEIKGAVEAMDWKLEAWAEENMPPTDVALERKQLISAAVWEMNPEPDRDDNGFEQTIKDILDAWGKGVSVCEIIWEDRRVGNLGDMHVPNCTTWIHPNNYAWSDEGFLGLNLGRDSSVGIFAGAARTIERFPEHKFLIAINKAKSGHPLTAARLRSLAWWWCAANFSADWLMNLAQLFGLPFRWATYSDNADEDTVTEINDMLENMGSSGRAAFPEGTNLNFLEGGKSAGTSPQDGLLDRADKACDLLILGQTLTSDVGASGGGSLALGKVHKGVREQIIQSAANFVARVFNQQLIPAILKENYGDADEAPYFCPEFESEKDLKATADLIKSAVDTGLQVPEKWAHAELNIPLPQAGEKCIERQAPASPFGMPGAPASGSARPNSTDKDSPDELEAGPSGLEARNAAALRAAAAAALTPEEKFILATAEKTDPVLALLNRIAAIKDDAAMMAMLKQFYTEAPSLTALITADVTRQQRALEVVTANALKKGLEGK